MREALESDPSRLAGEFADGNVAGNYSSPSQGFSVQSECHGAELAFILRWEYDEEIVLYVDQPPPIQITTSDKNGRRIRTWYTPDFLVISRNGVFIVEVKRGKELLKLKTERPSDWVQQSGEWIYVPAREHFGSIGLSHIVANASDLSRVETSNLKALIRVANSETHVGDELRESVRKALDRSAWLSLSELRSRAGAHEYGLLLKMLHEQQICIDITHALLSKPESVIVASTPEIVSAAIESITHDPGHSEIDVLATRVPGRKAAARVLTNLERVRTRNGRHERRLRRRIEEGAKIGLSPFQSLIWKYKGNSNSPLPKSVQKFLQSHIDSEKEEKKFKSGRAAYSDYKRKARKAHPTFEPVTRKTYDRWTSRIDPEEVAESTGGKRAKNAAKAPINVTDREIPATRPFERGCIDHTLLKLFAIVVQSNGRTYVRRPWLTALVDDYSDYWLSFYLSFNRPSRQALAMIFRNCVREYGRVPEFVHSDRGAELRSTFYQSLVAHMRSSADWNPASNSRFNSQAELINLHIQNKWISARPGNLIDYDNRRKYSKGYRPPDLAVLKLYDLFRELSAYMPIYNDTVIGVEEASPSELFERGLSDFQFSGIPVEFDNDFIIASSVETDAADYKIGANGDIFRNGLHFSHPELRRVRPRKSRVELRPDPEDPYKAYVNLGDQWVTALSGRHNVFRTGSDFERWGEAVRVSEGRPVRDFAKDHAGEVVAEELAEFDRRLQDNGESNVVEFPMHKGNPVSEKNALFAQLRDEELAELDSEDK